METDQGSVEKAMGNRSNWLGEPMDPQQVSRILLPLK